MAIFTAILTAIRAIGGFVARAASAVSTSWGAIVSQAIIYGGKALIASLTKQKSDYSPTYSDGVIQTQTNQNLPIPLLYGTCKLAGNRIWQDQNAQSTVKRIVAFAEGEICDFSDIRLNDIPITQISGISVKKYYGTKEQEVDSIVGGKTQEERAEKVGSLRDVAYLAITVPRGQKIDINYNLTTIVKGRKVRVYRTPLVYEIKYSENPAWVMFDFLTSYNGLGLGINNYGNISEDIIFDLFDIDSFIESAAFCDELVNKKPRFTFNMIFDAQTSARTLMDEIYRSCRGGLFIKNGKLQFKIDKAEYVSKVFTSQDIIKGSETFQTLPSEEHYDILKCEYISPDHEWQKVEAFAEIPEYRDGVPVEHTVSMYSCTNFNQASMLAWYYVNAKRLQPYFGSFKTDYKAYDLEVGDVILFDSLLMGLERYKAKVTSIEDDEAGVYIVNWRTYDERLYTDELGSKEPRAIVSNLDDIAKYPENVKSFNVVQSNNLFHFVWEYNQDAQNTYEIRVGDTWDRGTIIGSKITENAYAIEIPTNGLFKFWIKAFNGYNYSQIATLDVISIDSVPNVNEVIKFDVLANLEGIGDENIIVYNNTLKLKTEDILWETLDCEWYDSSGYYQTNGVWGGLTATQTGVYESTVYDLGEVLEIIASFDYQYTSIDEQNDVMIEWSYSDENENWSEWKMVNTGMYVLRYCKFRITLRAYNNVQTVLTKFFVSVDVPDKEIVMELEIKDIQGLRIEYDFISPPSIVATVNDSIDAYVVVDEKTNKYAVLKAFNNNGQLTTCKLSLRAKGF